MSTITIYYGVETATNNDDKGKENIINKEVKENICIDDWNALYGRLQTKHNLISYKAFPKQMIQLRNKLNKCMQFLLLNDLQADINFLRLIRKYTREDWLVRVECGFIIASNATYMNRLSEGCNFTSVKMFKKVFPTASESKMKKYSTRHGIEYMTIPFKGLYWILIIPFYFDVDYRQHVVIIKQNKIQKVSWIKFLGMHNVTYFTFAKY